MRTWKRPSILSGALVGGLLTAPLLAVLFLAERLVGLPFAPFDLFDWLARVLPGPVVTFGIDLILSVITPLNLGPTDSTAKTAEQLLAVGTFLIAGIVAGAVYVAALRLWETRWRDSFAPLAERPWLTGLALGLIVALPLLLIGGAVNTTALTAPVVSAIWTLVALLAWGAAHGWAYERLSVAVSVPQVFTEAIPGAAPIASVERVNRREFLIRLGGATAAITVIGTGLRALLNTGEPEVVSEATGGGAEAEAALSPTAQNLPNASDPLVPAPGTRPEYTPLQDHYRIDINIGRYPELDGETWRLPFSGLVDEPVEFTLDDLRAYEPHHQFVTLSCISNQIGGDLISTTRWTGVSLQRLLEDVPLSDEATHLKITSADGFYEIVALDVIEGDERVMLAYDWDGQPLLAEHGYPLRIYIPDRYGMKQPKWITGIEAIREWEPGYWVDRGWDRNAYVRTTSVIDTVAVDALPDGAEEGTLVPVGGIAYAGARGISQVEVRVDDGEWVEAQLRAPLSETTWVLWRYDWPFQAGRHTFAVRCRDGNDTPQIEDVRPPRPSGATGIDTLSVSA